MSESHDSSLNKESIPHSQTKVDEHNLVSSDTTISSTTNNNIELSSSSTSSITTTTPAIETIVPSNTTTTTSSSSIPIVKINKPNIRKRPRQRDTSDDDEDNTNNDNTNNEKLQTILEDQKYRSMKYNTGINSENINLIEKPISKKDTTSNLTLLSTDSSTTTVPLSTQSTSSTSSTITKASLFSNFDVRNTTTGNNLPDTEEDPLLKKYIEDKLQEYHNTNKKSSTASTLSSTTLSSQSGATSSSSSSSSAAPLLPNDQVTIQDIMTNPNKLYELPQHLQRSKDGSLTLKSLGLSSITTRNENGDVGTGGIILGGTGIAEVILPDKYKEKNQQETERLKELLIAKKQRNATIYQQSQLNNQTNESNSTNETTNISTIGSDNNRVVVGSYTANYSHHRKEFAISQRESEHHHRNNNNHHYQSQTTFGTATGVSNTMGIGNNHSNRNNQPQQPHSHHHQRKPVSNDDQLFNRFKKQEIASLRNR